ncbi:putative cytokinetic ring protein SteA [Paenibacillus hexagrammi]|uniref:Cytokinetic ring protein SteA n=1 Tax=Paenibacillus hexagrammi TaxID=2908839 RepID=A0ABY3SDF2_9BACL|nr:putative cytokinetic ring protein SteA [Paenibacillus sp. YPD9-1]UJF31216.1 putative cytokinetic ring protein SteA [Paenibacillus sp. YPD9-1]
MNWPSFTGLKDKLELICKGKISICPIPQSTLRALPPGRIVVMKQQDLDESTAQACIERKVKAVISCEEAMSGMYPSHGLLLLLRHGIPVWEASLEDLERFEQDIIIYMYGDYAVWEDQQVSCKLMTKEQWMKQMQSAQSWAADRMESLIEQTLKTALQHKHEIVHRQPLPDLPVDWSDKHVLVVAGGKDCLTDVEDAKAYIRDFRPILIAVERGADVLLDCGYKPHLIVGALGSMSDRALHCGAELIVHHERDAEESELQRLRMRGLRAQAFTGFGTSTEVSMLLAFEKGASWIVTAGTDTHMINFLENGRTDMGGALLVQMKAGHRLIDIKSVNMFYQQKRSQLTETLITLCLSAGFIALTLLQMDWITDKWTQVVWKLGGYG